MAVTQRAFEPEELNRHRRRARAARRRPRKGVPRLPPPGDGGQRGPAFGQYRPDPEGGHKPWALQVLEISGERISGFHAFLDTTSFAAFGLPTHLPA